MTKHFTSSSPVAFDGQLASARNLTAAGLAIVAVTYGLARYCFGLFLPDIRKEFGIGTETIGLIAGLSYAGYLLATFVGSWLSTVFEPRLPILLGGIAATIGMAIIGFAGDPWMLATGVFIAGASPGLSYPPFSDVIVQHTEQRRQNTTYAWINSGTGFGVALAGPLALYAGENWRLAWLAFAALALAVTLWNLSALPRRRTFGPRVSTGASIRILLEPRAVVLFAAALVFGIITAVYWTYAVELLWALTGNSRDAVFFWFVLGIAGVSGCFAGGLVDRWGLGRTYCVLALMIGGAVATLPLMIGTRIGIYVSAACFGAGFIVMTALFGIWSMNIFRQTPSIGFGFTFFLISLGQGVGPVIGGYAIPVVGHPMLFTAAGLLCCCLALLPPRVAPVKQ
ncbi:YbfB/YjiJ family MFS transporter [Rhodobacterales bacterium]|nr:YbfB/YjiJ family MFS transporter [Rhodobacterales bacterium]